MAAVADFRPHPLLRDGHLQTLVALWDRRWPSDAQQRTVTLADGDALVLHDETPPSWRPGDGVAILAHGLGGSHASGYAVRIAAKLVRRGVRSMRLDWRGCGAGAALATRPFHSGRSDDLAAVIDAVVALAPGSPITLAAFSLGGNVALKLLGERAGALPRALDRAVVVCPPVDLAACVRALDRFPHRLYDRHFARELLTQVAAHPQWRTHAFPVRPRGLRAFDEAFTAGYAGYPGADAYYAGASALPWLERITLPTAILVAQDDPVVDHRPLLRARTGPGVAVTAPAHGGHLGFLGGIGPQGRRWMDAWVIAQVGR